MSINITCLRTGPKAPATLDFIMRFKAGVTRQGLNPKLIRMIHEAEEISGDSFIITDAVRPAKMAGPEKIFPPPAHEEGLAVDIRVSGCRERWKIREALEKAGFRRIGIYDKNIHADICPHRVGFCLWGGVSK